MTQGNTSRLVQDVISQALAKPQDTKPTRANPPREPRILQSDNGTEVTSKLI